MSVILRVGAVHTDFAKDGVCTDIDSFDDGSAEDYSRPPSHYFPGCFGLPYQDHNYGAPPPPSPLPKVPSPLEFVDKVNGHIEVEEVSVTSIGQQASVDITSDNVDDSITRCICDFTHDDGYMICCDKCSVWQHIDCMAVDRSNIPDNYFCELCESRPMDKERARQIQLRKREFILGADSSTDTDPEEPANRRMSQDMVKKCKTKRRTKTMKIKDEKGKRMRNYRKEVKKEKENKDTAKKLRISLKESFKKTMKNKPNKKPGLLSMVLNENSQQDPWDSSCSPWVDKYEEAKENQYSSDMQAILGLKKLNGSLSCSGNYNYNRNGRILVELCHVTEVNKNRKGLEASETIGEGEAIIEYTGHVMLREQFNKENFYKRLNPFVLFNSMFDNIELCIDATSYGNIARFIRRSCKSNSEVKHTFEDGELTFIVVATKVIPRGSEITIPYDYNYKECTYCVECACLRNNCPVAKYFKRKQSAENRKEKVISKRSSRRGKSPSWNGKNSVKLVNQHPKSPKSPASSLSHSPSKSPVRKSISVEEPTIIEELQEIEPEIPALPPPPVVSPVKEERASEVIEAFKEESPIDHNTDSGTDHHDTHSESEENPSSERTRRMSREDRKMEAIMKAFEKMEKRQERRKEALARIEGTKKPILNKTEDIKKEKGKGKSQEEQKEPKKTNDYSSSTEEVKRETVKAKSEKLDQEIKETTLSLASPSKKENKVSHKKRRKSSSKRKARAQSTNAVKSEPQSQDEGSNTVPSCPSTPVSAPPDVPLTPPSFKFLKTKKHLMNEWLSEKNQDVAPLPPPSHPSKIEPLEVQVEEVMYVACKPSPRNAIDHLRRNSTSAGSSPYSSLPSLNKQCGENSIGSAKKRWLRQAMFDKPIPGALSRPMSPLGPAGGSSPNPHPSLPSPGGSPPGDYITPLKKRRLASYRESLDQPYTGASDIGSSAAEDQSDEPLDTNSADQVTSYGVLDHVEDTSVGDIVKQEMENASSCVRHADESVSDDTVHIANDIVVLRTEKATGDIDSSCVSSHMDSVIQSSNECDSRQEIDSAEDHANTCDFNCQKIEVMEVDSTQSDSSREMDKKEALCDSTCKVEDIRACSSSQSVTFAELSLVDSSSDVNLYEQSSKVVQVNADSIVDNMSGGHDSLLLENVCSSSDRNVLISNFDVSSSSESNQSSSQVESSQVTDSVNVSSTEQTCSLYSATSNLESGVADSSMSDHKTELSDICVSDVSGTGDSVHYVNNFSATESVGEPVASSSIADDSGVSSEPTTPLETQPPTKKKVSLLEYRKRLKEKTVITVSTPSCSKSSVITAPSSTTSPIHRHHRFSTLPSLPMFDSSPTKDNSSRYQFKSSSDLIRKKSPDNVKEKRPQLSLSERLRMEFGLDDSEEEKDSEKEVVSTPVTSSVQHTPVFQHPPVMLRGPTPGLVPNGPSTGPVPTVTNMNGSGAGPMGSSPVLSSKGPTSHLLMNGTQPLGLLPACGGKAIPSLLSIKTYPSRNLPNGSDTGSTPPSGVDQANMFQSKSQDTPSNQSFIVNHINRSPVGTTPQTSFYPSSNGTQQTFSGANMSSNGPIVCDYNHGYNNSEQSIQKHYHPEDQRKKSKKFKRKHYNSYQDSGGGHFH